MPKRDAGAGFCSARNLLEGALHGVRPAVEEGGQMTKGRLIGRKKFGKTAKLLGAAEADGGPIRLFLTAGRVSDSTGAAALLASCWLIGAMTLTA